jgi:peptide-methionine (R)-S-oxide reductase
MHARKSIPVVATALIALIGCNGNDPERNANVSFEVNKSDAEWQEQLTDQQYHVLREKGTEQAFTGTYWNTKAPGTYVCAGCGQPLFDSEAKFESGTGWPSFTEPVSGERLAEQEDNRWGMSRTEVVCSRCGGHLGHVFQDGPKPTGRRYCINSVSLNLDPAE